MDTMKVEFDLECKFQGGTAQCENGAQFPVLNADVRVSYSFFLNYFIL
jgi:hypothetical protein